MNREILTFPIDTDQMYDELAYFVEHFRKLGYEYRETLFGSFWGSDYYATSDWQPVRIPLADLMAEVHRVESAGMGHFGREDLFIKIPPLAIEFRFCNDSDIHISFESPCEITEFFYQRWKAHGFSPAEWSRTDEGMPHERLRIN
ncbi:MAG TPA: hypothetical protein VGY55_04400 [Pirellulales bacterium]|jgi:hypothetical protein|nr:hypothetical protein [Pirellulales bacterium]